MFQGRPVLQQKMEATEILYNTDHHNRLISQFLYLWMAEECIYLTVGKDKWGYGNSSIGDMCASFQETLEIVRICVNNNGEQMVNIN
jgi:hypothetical protein